MARCFWLPFIYWIDNFIKCLTRCDTDVAAVCFSFHFINWFFFYLYISLIIWGEFENGISEDEDANQQALITLMIKSMFLYLYCVFCCRRGREAWNCTVKVWGNPGLLHQAPQLHHLIYLPCHYNCFISSCVVPLTVLIANFFLFFFPYFSSLNFLWRMNKSW